MQLKQQILFALKQELGIEGQPLMEAYYYFNTLNLGVKFYDFVIIKDKPFSFEIENDLKTLIPKQDLSYNSKLDPFLLIAIKEMKNQSLKLPIFKSYNVSGRGLYTVGYEGMSLDVYLSKLLNNGIKAVVDVRGNAYSKKFGFSKSELSVALRKVDILYFHIPELGISSEKREHAGIYEGNASAILFNNYENDLPLKQNYIQDLISIYNKHKSVVITCFEKDPCNCHRSRLAKFLKIDFKNL